MWKKKLKELIYILEQSDINEIEASFWGRKYRVVKNPGIIAGGIQHTALTHLLAAKEGGAAPAESSPENPSINILEVRSPMPGTFYTAPAPGEDPYVQPGDRVQKGQSMCIVEAMKIMNEIETNVSGVVKEILVENGAPVEYNQPLFRIE